jgi:hypothetical protein
MSKLKSWIIRILLGKSSVFFPPFTWGFFLDPMAAAPPLSNSAVSSTLPQSSPLTISATQPVQAVLADMLRLHKAKIAAIKDQNETKYKACGQAASLASASLVDAANKDVIDIFHAEQAIEAQIKEVTVRTEQFHKKLQQWAGLFAKFNRSLKELGDVHHWAQCVEGELQDSLKILDAVSASKRKALGME